VSPDCPNTKHRTHDHGPAFGGAVFALRQAWTSTRRCVQPWNGWAAPVRDPDVSSIHEGYELRHQSWRGNALLSIQPIGPLAFRHGSPSLLLPVGGAGRRERFRDGDTACGLNLRSNDALALTVCQRGWDHCGFCRREQGPPACQCSAWPVEQGACLLPSDVGS